MGNKEIDNNYSNTSVSFSPFLSYYLPCSPNSNLRFYAQIGGGIELRISDNNETTFYNSGRVDVNLKTNYPDKYFGFSLEGFVGLNYFIVDNVAINGALGCVYNKAKESKSETWILSDGTQVTSPEWKAT